MKKLIIFIGLLFISLTALASDLIVNIKSEDLGAFVQFKLEGEVGFLVKKCYYEELVNDGCRVVIPKEINSKKVVKAWIGANRWRTTSIFESRTMPALVEIDLKNKSTSLDPQTFYFSAQSEKDYNLRTLDSNGRLSPAGLLQLSDIEREVKLKFDQ